MQELTPPRSPQSNRVAERMNQTFQDEARAMMQHTRDLMGANGGECFWQHSSSERNVGDTTGAVELERADYRSHQVIWLCGVMPHQQEGWRGRSWDSAVLGSIGGVCRGRPICTGVEPSQGEEGVERWGGRISMRTNLEEMEVVAFLDQNGDGKPLVGGDGIAASGDGPLVNPGGPPAPPPPPFLPPPPPLDAGKDEEEMSNLVPSDVDDDDNDPLTPPLLGVSARENRGVPTARYDEIFVLVADILSPPSVTVAIEGDKAAEWSGALDSELQSLWDTEVFEEVDWPARKKVIGTKWVLRVKVDSESSGEGVEAHRGVRLRQNGRPNSAF